MNAVSGISRLLMVASLGLAGGCDSEDPFVGCIDTQDCIDKGNSCPAGQELFCNISLDGICDCEGGTGGAGGTGGTGGAGGTGGTSGTGGTGGVGGMSAVSVVDAYVSPPLPPSPGRTAHFTGVTQFVLAELSPAQAALELTWTCTSSGVTCPSSFNVSAQYLPVAEVSLSFTLPENGYDFVLVATLDGMASAERELAVGLAPRLGELKCEESTNGQSGQAEVRSIGLKLQTPLGQPISNGDYYLYHRVDSTPGWTEYDTFLGREKVVLSGSSEEFSTNRNFHAIAVDRGISPPAAIAPREWRYNDLIGPQYVTTLGCERCSITGGTPPCEIIP